MMPDLPADTRSCSRCGEHFIATGRPYLCDSCRKARKARGPLSNRELQIVELVSKGRTNKEIAYESCLTEGTVKQYLLHIFRKLKVTNRTELALSAVRSHLPTDGLIQAS